MRQIPSTRLLLRATLSIFTLATTTRAQTPPKLPFTISKETTAITSPLNKDGSVDYISAINQRYGNDIKPEENAFTAWLEIVGTGPNVLSPKTAPKILEMCGAKDVGEVKWQTYIEFLKTKGQDDPTITERMDDDSKAQKKLWNQNDFPLLAEYLTQNDRVFKQIRAAVSRPKYWLPSIPGDGRSLKSVLLPSLGIMRGMSNLLAADATRRAASDDFDGFLSDVVAVKQLSRHLRSQPTLIENLVGIAIDNVSNQAIGAAAGSGKLSAKQATALSNILNLLPPAQEVTESVNLMERWSYLDTVALIAQGQWGSLSLANDTTTNAYQMLNQESVDWDTILKRINILFNEQIDALKQPTFTDIDAQMKKVSQLITNKKSTDLSQQTEESRQAYTARVGDAILSDFMPWFNSVTKNDLASRMGDQMAIAITAAARYHAEKNKWPEHLSELVPAYLKQVPMDVWSSDPTQEIKYLHDDTTARLYSVGRNHIDDGGISDPELKLDDLIVGAQSNQ